MSRRSRRHHQLPKKSELANTAVSSDLAQTIIFGLFNFLVLVVPFIFTWVNKELFEFPKMLVVYALTVVIAAAWVSRMVLSQRLIWRRTKFDLWIGLFLVSQLLSTIFSMHWPTSVYGYYTRFHGGLLSTISYIILFYAFVSNLEKKHLKKLLITVFISAIGTSLYSIPEHFGHSPSCWLISHGQNFDVSCWVQDVKSRVFGTFGQPNWLAAFNITLIPVSITLFLNRKNKLSISLFYLVTLVLLFTSLIFTESRSGFLGLAIGLGIMGLGLGWLSRLQLTVIRNLSGKLLILGLIMLGLAIGFGTPFTPSLAQFWETTHQSSSQPPSTAGNPVNNPDLAQVTAPAPIVNRLEVGGTDSGEIRKIVWQGAFKVWQRYPILGSGVETFAYSYYQDRPQAHNDVSEWDFLYNKAHNEFLNFLATTGLVGLVTYLLLWGSFGFYTSQLVAQRTQHSSKSSPANHQIPSDQLLALGLLSGVVALSVSNFFGFSTVAVSILMWLFLAMAAILNPRTLNPRQTLSARHTTATLASTDKPPYFSLSIVALLSLYALFLVYNSWSADKLYALGEQLVEQQQLVDGAQILTQAVQKSPQALYLDTLSLAQAQIAASLAALNESTTAAQFADQAIATSDQVLLKNPVHLNFYKTRARIFIFLAELDPSYLNQALESLQLAQDKAPTDAKILYNRALILHELGQTEPAISLLKQAIELKPNYVNARSTLGSYYQQQGLVKLAQEQYQYILDYISPQDETTRHQLELLKITDHLVN